MAKRRVQSQRGAGRGRPMGGGAGGVVLAFLMGGVAAAGAGYLYLHSLGRAVPGSVPSSAPLRSPASSVPGASPRVPPEATAAPAVPATTVGAPPFGASEDVFEAGARIYSAHCANCHGVPGRNASPRGRPAPQIFGEARHRIAAEPLEERYRVISVGAPSRGMPAYARSLSDTALWQMTLLLGSADQPLPDPVTALLTHPQGGPPR